MSSKFRRGEIGNRVRHQRSLVIGKSEIPVFVADLAASTESDVVCSDLCAVLTFDAAPVLARFHGEVSVKIPFHAHASRNSIGFHPIRAHLHHMLFPVHRDLIRRFSSPVS